MLRTVFVGFDNDLNRVLAHWLEQRTDLAGCVWIPSTTQWLTTRKGRMDFLRQRLKKRGLLRTLDEALFFLYYHATERNNSNTRAASQLVKDYWRNNELANGWGPFLPTRKINDEKVIKYVERLKPDIIISHCIHQFFGKRLRNAAKHGVFLLHIGILPEYRGLYSPFWTLHNCDFDNFGYTLFRLNEGIDAGEAFVQGRTPNVDVAHDNHALIEFKTVFAALPAIEEFFKEMENGTAKPIERPNAVPGYYSYPGLTDYIRQRIRVRRALRERGRTDAIVAKNPETST
jgi:folate-dependent phosphoribosylglycinamide formyltransferase PurN